MMRMTDHQHSQEEEEEVWDLLAFRRTCLYHLLGLSSSSSSAEDVQAAALVAGWRIHRQKRKQFPRSSLLVDNNNNKNINKEEEETATTTTTRRLRLGRQRQQGQRHVSAVQLLDMLEQCRQLGKRYQHIVVVVVEMGQQQMVNDATTTESNPQQQRHAVHRALYAALLEALSCVTLDHDGDSSNGQTKHHYEKKINDPSRLSYRAWIQFELEQLEKEEEEDQQQQQEDKGASSSSSSGLTHFLAQLQPTQRRIQQLQTLAMVADLLHQEETLFPLSPAVLLSTLTQHVQQRQVHHHQQLLQSLLEKAATTGTPSSTTVAIALGKGSLALVDGSLSMGLVRTIASSSRSIDDDDDTVRRSLLLYRSQQQQQV